MTLTAAEIVRILHDHVKAMYPGQLVSEPVLGCQLCGMDAPPTSTIYATFEVTARRFDEIRETIQRIP